MNDQERKDAALSALAILAEIYRENSNALLTHGITSDAGDPQSAFVRLAHNITQLAK